MPAIEDGRPVGAMIAVAEGAAARGRPGLVEPRLAEGLAAARPEWRFCCAIAHGADLGNLRQSFCHGSRTMAISVENGLFRPGASVDFAGSLRPSTRPDRA